MDPAACLESAFGRCRKANTSVAWTATRRRSIWAVRRVVSAPARTTVGTKSLAHTLAKLDLRLHGLASKSQCAELVAISKQYSREEDDYTDLTYDETRFSCGAHVEVSERTFLKRAPRAQLKGAGQHAYHASRSLGSSGGHVRTSGGGPAVVHSRHGAHATRHRAIVGGRTHHYAVAEPSRGAPSRKRFEQREWHRASRLPSVTTTRVEWREHNAAAREARARGGAQVYDGRDARDVVQQSEIRHVPLPGQMACDSEIDPETLAASLPDDVLAMISAEHQRLHRAIRDEHGEEAVKENRDRADRPLRAMPWKEHELQVGRARVKQWRRARCAR